MVRRLPCSMLVVIAAGEGLMRLDGRIMRFRAGQIYKLDSHMQVELYPEGGDAELDVLLSRSLLVHRRGRQWDCRTAGNSVAYEPGYLALKPCAQAAMGEWLERLRRAWQSGGEVQPLFQSLLQYVSDGMVTGEERSGEPESILDGSIAHMHRHYREKIKLGTLSDLAGLTPTSYSRSFKKMMGVSPMEYLNGIRLNHSKLLLNQPGMTVNAAAQSSGFGNEFYYSRVFKRQTGISPTMFIRRRQLRVAVACCMRYEDCLRSMGVEPVCAMNGLLHFQEEGEEARLAHYQQMQLEAIRRAEPDVILADFRHQAFYSRLKAIAPTVVLEFSNDWRKVHTRLAGLIGREEEARANILLVEQRIALARRLLAADNTGRSLSYLRLYGPKIRVQGRVNHPLNILLYQELGLAPGSGAPFGEAYREYELEELRHAGAEDLFIYDDPDRSEDESLLLSRLQSSLAAERQGEDNRLYSASNWIGKSWSPLGQQQIIDELLRLELGTGAALADA